QVFLRGANGEHRTHLVLLAVDPRNEEHLNGTAAVPVALLVVRAHAPHARSIALRHHGRIALRLQRCGSHLPLGSGGASNGAELSVGPGLRVDPLDCVNAVGTWWPEYVVVALGEEVTALVLLDVGVAALDGGECSAHVTRRTVPD